MREKREEINKNIGSDEQEKAKIQNDLAILTKRLSQLNDKLARQVRPARGLYPPPEGVCPPRTPPPPPHGRREPPSRQRSVSVGRGVPRPRVPRGAEKAGPSPAAQPPRGVEEPVKRGPDAGRARPQVASRNEYDKTIQETEAAYLKILESSQTLLTVLKRESVNISKKRQASS